MHKANLLYLDETDETETVGFPDWKEMTEIESFVSFLVTDLEA